MPVGRGGGRGGLFVGLGEDEFGGTVARERVVELVLRGEGLHGELARGEVEEREAEARDGGDVGVDVLVEEAVLGDGAGRHDARHLAPHDLPLLDEAGVLHLVADRGGLPRADELREVGVQRVVGNAAERCAAALGERGAEDGRGDDRVLGEHLVEVPEAEHQDGARRQRAFDRTVLPLHGCEFVRHPAKARAQARAACTSGSSARRSSGRCPGSGRISGS